MLTANRCFLQAIGLLDDLDKELNTYAMRVREWYGWHFPEMTKIVSDNIAYAKAVRVHSGAWCVSLFAWAVGCTALWCAGHVCMGVAVHVSGTGRAWDQDLGGHME